MVFNKAKKLLMIEYGSDLKIVRDRINTSKNEEFRMALMNLDRILTKKINSIRATSISKREPTFTDKCQWCGQLGIHEKCTIQKRKFAVNSKIMEVA